MRPRVLVVVGARPNFVKVAPVLHALRETSVEPRLLHTGQHYDYELCESFLELLDFPQPDFELGVGSASHAKQTADVMVGCEEVLRNDRFDAILVPGDVNSTLGASLAAAKEGCPVIHLEAGLRSRDWSMPEEINRVVTDRLSSLLLCHCDEAVRNLAAEGITSETVQMVGNTMIDSLLRLRDDERAQRTLERFSLEARRYVLVTLHRPSTVDHAQRLREVMEVLAELTLQIPVVFPVHPRTRANIERIKIRVPERLRLLESLDYLRFIDLESQARLVITDSGGVQEETSALFVPCITYRTTTERPVTISLGTNELVGVAPVELRAACARNLNGGARVPPGQIPLWDGEAGTRAAASIEAFVHNSSSGAA